MAVLENKQFEGIHYSRFIASFETYHPGWSRCRDVFKVWLSSLIFDDDNRMPEDVQDEICEMASMGKMELEISACQFDPEKELNRLIDEKEYE